MTVISVYPSDTLTLHLISGGVTTLLLHVCRLEQALDYRKQQGPNIAAMKLAAFVRAAQTRAAIPLRRRYFFGVLQECAFAWNNQASSFPVFFF